MTCPPSSTCDEPAAASFTDDGIARVRDVAERAITAGGLHVCQGAVLWEAWRAYEEQLRQHVKGADQRETRTKKTPTTTPTQHHVGHHPQDDNCATNQSHGQRRFHARSTGSTKKHDAQVEIVRRLWHRQLAVPLQGVDATLEAYRQWESDLPTPGAVPPSITAAAKAAATGVRLRLVREAAIAQGEGVAGTAQLAGYTAYVQLETTQGDPARVQVWAIIMWG